MPFYDMECQRCGLKFNVMATVEEKEKNLIPCIGCGSHELKRIYETVNLVVKSRQAEAQMHQCKCCSHADSCPNAK